MHDLLPGGCGRECSAPAAAPANGRCGNVIARSRPQRRKPSRNCSLAASESQLRWVGWLQRVRRWLLTNACGTTCRIGGDQAVVYTECPGGRPERCGVYTAVVLRVQYGTPSSAGDSGGGQRRNVVTWRMARAMVLGLSSATSSMTASDETTRWCGSRVEDNGATAYDRRLGGRPQRCGVRAAADLRVRYGTVLSGRNRGGGHRGDIVTCRVACAAVLGLAAAAPTMAVSDESTRCLCCTVDGSGATEYEGQPGDRPERCGARAAVVLRVRHGGAVVLRVPRGAALSALHRVGGRSRASVSCKKRYCCGGGVAAAARRRRRCAARRR